MFRETVKDMIIYKIVNNINGKVYVGQTIQPLNKRISYHVWQNRLPIQKALNKYGIQSFTISIIDSADSKDVLDEKEKYWIKFLDCRAPNGYNLTDGGEGLKNPTEKIRRKIGEASSRRIVSDVTRERISKALTGHSVSQEQRTKIGNLNRGKQLSAVTKKKISLKNRGRKNPPHPMKGKHYEK